MSNFSVVSSDDVIASYRQQLADAHHAIAVLEARLTKALRYIGEQSQPQQAEMPDAQELER